MVLGIIVAYQETAYFRSKEVQYAAVVRLKEDILVNTIVRKEQLEYVNYPKDIINDEFIQKIDQAAGKYAERNLKAGTPLFISDIADHKAVVVPEGMVRVTFAANLPDALAGAIAPGSFVNIGYVAKDGSAAKLLFSDIQIAKITNKSGQDISNGSYDKKPNGYVNNDIIPATVTVILPSDDSILLKQYELQGRIFITGY